MEMQYHNSEIHHYTPPASELLPNYEIKCAFESCSAIFTNNGSYQMHIQRHHKVPASSCKPVDTNMVYHCPTEDCKYNVTLNGYFTNLRNLRQHYQKVHVPKSHECHECGKCFITLQKLAIHKCGQKFRCDECHWQYDTREALLTHAKRKGHKIFEPKTEHAALQAPKLPIPRLPRPIQANKPSKRCIEQETQTASKRVCVASIQTESASMAPTPTHALLDLPTPMQLTDTNPFDAMLRDIETQTENCLQTSTATNTTLDPMFGQTSSHMYTQTCGDDFFNELGLADIQTQTSWTPTHGDIDKLPYGADVAPHSGTNAHDELFVSTETQTSFTQYFLDSCKSATDAATSTMSDNYANTFYNTQYTQTCDTLLDSWFGDQEQDIMTSFQSAYTQT